MRTWRRFVIALVVLATAFLLYRWWQNANARAQRRAPGAGDLDEPPQAAATAAAPPATHMAANAGEGAEGRSGPKLDRARADKMREELHALFAEAGVLALAGEAIDANAPAPAASFGSMPVLGLDDAGNPKVDPEYIRKRVREDLFPLALDCYGEALKRDPKLAGKLVVYFRVIGDKKVGGVVDDTRLEEGTTIADPEMQTCVRESMMSVSFDAPPEGGGLTVVYPIEFSPDDPDSGTN
jgi:hypothetical protein